MPFVGDVPATGSGAVVVPPGFVESLGVPSPPVEPEGVTLVVGGTATVLLADWHPNKTDSAAQVRAAATPMGVRLTIAILRNLERLRYGTPQQSI